MSKYKESAKMLHEMLKRIIVIESSDNLNNDIGFRTTHFFEPNIIIKIAYSDEELWRTTITNIAKEGDLLSSFMSDDIEKFIYREFVLPKCITKQIPTINQIEQKLKTSIQKLNSDRKNYVVFVPLEGIKCSTKNSLDLGSGKILEANKTNFEKKLQRNQKDLRLSIKKTNIKILKEWLFPSKPDHIILFPYDSKEKRRAFFIFWIEDVSQNRAISEAFKEAKLACNVLRAVMFDNDFSSIFLFSPPGTSCRTSFFPISLWDSISDDVHESSYGLYGGGFDEITDELIRYSFEEEFEKVKEILRKRKNRSEIEQRLVRSLSLLGSALLTLGSIPSIEKGSITHSKGKSKRLSEYRRREYLPDLADIMLKLMTAIEAITVEHSDVPTETVSNRFVSLLHLQGEEAYNKYRQMKHIYSDRSSIVHGREIFASEYYVRILARDLRKALRNLTEKMCVLKDEKMYFEWLDKERFGANQ